MQAQSGSNATTSPPKIPRNLPDWFYNMNDGDVDRMIWREVILKERVERRKKRLAAMYVRYRAV